MLKFEHAPWCVGNISLVIQKIQSTNKSVWSSRICFFELVNTNTIDCITHIDNHISLYWWSHILSLFYILSNVPICFLHTRSISYLSYKSFLQCQEFDLIVDVGCVRIHHWRGMSGSIFPRSKRTWSIPFGFLHKPSKMRGWVIVIAMLRVLGNSCSWGKR